MARIKVVLGERARAQAAYEADAARLARLSPAEKAKAAAAKEIVAAAAAAAAAGSGSGAAASQKIRGAKRVPEVRYV